MLLNEDIAADVVAYDKTGKLILMAEAQGIPDRTPEWAARFRENFLERDPQQDPQYFLIVTADKIFLWDHAGTPTRLPDAEMDAAPLFQRYLDHLQVRPKQLSHESIEVIMRAWISSLEWQAVPEDSPLAGLAHALGEARIVSDIT